MNEKWELVMTHFEMGFQRVYFVYDDIQNLLIEI